MKTLSLSSFLAATVLSLEFSAGVIAGERNPFFAMDTALRRMNMP